MADNTFLNTNPNNAYEIPGEQFSLHVKTNIEAYRFMSVDADGYGIQATASTPVVGVSRTSLNASEGIEQDMYLAKGIMMVMCGEAITPGAEVASNADGKAVAGTGTGMIAITGSTKADVLVSVQL